MRRHILAIRDQGGGARMRDLRPRHIEADLSPLAPSVARARLKAWRYLCKFIRWSDYGLTDPSAMVARPKMPKSDGFPPWGAAEIAAYRERWPIGTVARAAFELLYWTGARVSDAVRIGPGMIGKDGVLAYAQQKTGGMAYVPWRCALPDYAAGMAGDRDQLHQALACLEWHMTFIPTIQGRLRSAAGLSNDMTAFARDAGLSGRTAHGLRKSRAKVLAEAGATPHQIGAWTGHESLAEVAHYTRAADRRRAVTGTEQDRNRATLLDPWATRAE